MQFSKRGIRGILPNENPQIINFAKNLIMKLSVFSFLTIVFLAAACNNASTPGETMADTMSHGGHMDMATAEVPALEPIPDSARVYFKNLKNGSVVTSPFQVEMGVDHMSVDTANGKIKPASGHHHILIGLDSIPAGTVVPKDSTHLHFGNAQTSTQVTLSPGTYKLSLQFADALHRSYGGKLSNTIEVKVK